jgi:hypothetical protein
MELVQSYAKILERLYAFKHIFLLVQHYKFRDKEKTYTTVDKLWLRPTPYDLFVSARSLGDKHHKSIVLGINSLHVKDNTANAKDELCKSQESSFNTRPSRKSMETQERKLDIDEVGVL